MYNNITLSALTQTNLNEFFKQLCTPKQTGDIDPMLNQCWSTVHDAGPTLVQHCVDVSYLLGQKCISEYYFMSRFADYDFLW